MTQLFYSIHRVKVVAGGKNALFQSTTKSNIHCADQIIVQFIIIYEK